MSLLSQKSFTPIEWGYYFQFLFIFIFLHRIKSLLTINAFFSKKSSQWFKLSIKLALYHFWKWWKSFCFDNLIRCNEENSLHVFIVRGNHNSIDAKAWILIYILVFEQNFLVKNMRSWISLKQKTVFLRAFYEKMLIRYKSMQYRFIVRCFHIL